MTLYEFMASKRWPRSYNGKILLVSFLGVHVPMLGAVTYVLVADSAPLMDQLDVLAAMLVATLIGTAATMFVLYSLLSPVRAASQAAEAYLRRRETPRLPIGCGDEAGVLMASVQECITRLDASLAATEYQYQLLEQDHSDQFKMLAGMKHDFRTPLTHILGFSALMESEAIGPLGNETYQEFAGKIGSSGEELLQTLNSLIDLSDSQCASQRDEDSEDFDVAELLREAAALSHLHAEKTGVALDLNLPDYAAVNAVRTATESLLGAMLHAGISASPEGSRVSVRISEGQSDTVIRLASPDGKLSLEDVPTRLAHHFDGLRSYAGSTSLVAETSTPVTLRLSLVDTLARVIGARFEMAQDESSGFALSVTLASGEMPTMLARAA